MRGAATLQETKRKEEGTILLVGKTTTTKSITMARTAAGFRILFLFLSSLVTIPERISLAPTPWLRY